MYQDQETHQLSFSFQILEKNNRLIEKIKYFIRYNKFTGFIIVGNKSSGKTAVMNYLRTDKQNQILVNCSKVLKNNIPDLIAMIKENTLSNYNSSYPIVRKLPILLDNIDEILTKDRTKEELFILKDLLDKIKELNIPIILSSSTDKIITELPDLDSRLRTFYIDYLI